MVRLILLICILCMPGQAAAQNTVAVEIDGSGSMEGFFNSGSIKQLIDEITEAGEQSGLEVISEVFVSKNRKSMEWIDLETFRKRPQFGKYSLLDQAFKEGQKRAPIIIFITDNVLASGSADDVSRLYESFNSNQVQDLYLLPLIRQFSGYVFGDDMHIDSLLRQRSRLQSENPDGRFSQITDTRAIYTGLRGMAGYIARVDDKSQAQYQRLTTQLEKQFARFLLVKPITSSQISLENMRWQKPALLQSGQPAHTLSHDFTMDSNLQHLHIGYPSDSTTVTLNVSNPLIIPLDELGNALFRNGVLSGQISPPHLTGRLEAGGKTKHTYRSIITLMNTPQMTQPMDTFILLALQDQVQAQVSFNIEMVVPPSHFSFTEDYRDQFFTNSVYRLDRIYSPVDLIQTITTKETRIQMPVATMIQYEVPPLFLYILAAIVFLGLVFIGLVIYLWRGPSFGYEVNPGFTSITHLRLKPFGRQKKEVKNTNDTTIGFLTRSIKQFQLEPARDFEYYTLDETKDKTGAQPVLFNQEINIQNPDGQRWIFRLKK